MGAVFSAAGAARQGRHEQPTEAQKPGAEKTDFSNTGSSSASTLIHSYDVGPVESEDQDDSLQVTVYRGADVTFDETTGTWRESASKMLCCFNSASAYLQRTVQSQSAFWGGTTALHAVTRRFSRDLLGPVPQDCNGRLTVVLDLDETLVHSSFTPIEDPDFVTSIVVDGAVMEVHVNKRPWLDHFLEQVVQHFEVVIFTASVEPYADAVLAHIDPKHTIHSRLCRGSCVLHAGTYVKDLARLGRDVGRTVLVDNSTASGLFQPENLIVSDTWIDDPSDIGLLHILRVLMNLRDCVDVRLALPAAQIAAGYTP